ncbi:hypothetical protein ACFFRR_002545 [Megaselia abdita]
MKTVIFTLLLCGLTFGDVSHLKHNDGYLPPNSGSSISVSPGFSNNLETANFQPKEGQVVNFKGMTIQRSQEVHLGSFMEKPHQSFPSHTLAIPKTNKAYEKKTEFLPIPQPESFKGDGYLPPQSDGQIPEPQYPNPVTAPKPIYMPMPSWFRNEILRNKMDNHGLNHLISSVSQSLINGNRHFASFNEANGLTKGGLYSPSASGYIPPSGHQTTNSIAPSFTSSGTSAAGYIPPSSSGQFSSPGNGLVSSISTAASGSGYLPPSSSGSTSPSSSGLFSPSGNGFVSQPASNSNTGSNSGYLPPSSSGSATSQSKYTPPSGNLFVPSAVSQPTSSLITGSNSGYLPPTSSGSATSQSKYIPPSSSGQFSSSLNGFVPSTVSQSTSNTGSNSGYIPPPATSQNKYTPPSGNSFVPSPVSQSTSGYISPSSSMSTTSQNKYTSPSGNGIVPSTSFVTQSNSDSGYLPPSSGSQTAYTAPSSSGQSSHSGNSFVPSKVSHITSNSIEPSGSDSGYIPPSSSASILPSQNNQVSHSGNSFGPSKVSSITSNSMEPSGSDSGYLPPSSSASIPASQTSQLLPSENGVALNNHVSPSDSGYIPPTSNGIQESHQEPFDEIESHDDGYAYEKVEIAPFEEEPSQKLPTQTDQFRTLQIFNKNSKKVSTFKVLEKAEENGLKTIKIIGRTNKTPPQENFLRTVQIVGGKNNEPLQTVKIFNDSHGDNKGYLPPESYYF